MQKQYEAIVAQNKSLQSELRYEKILNKLMREGYSEFALENIKEQAIKELGE